jgi:uncharacterized membrane protein HdeD (DUF308 family)
MAGNLAEGLGETARLAKRLSSWSIALAIVFILIGLFAIIEPGVAGLAATFLVAWLLVLGGIAHIVHAFRGGGAGKIVWDVLIGLCYLVGAFYFFTHPLLGLGTLTLLLAAIIFVAAVFEFMAYFRRRGEHGSGWLLVNGIITFLLAVLIWLHWPSSSVWAIGTLVGVSLLMTGISRLMMGLATRQLLTHATAAPSSLPAR